jgi:hypothetical protein
VSKLLICGIPHCCQGLSHTIITLLFEVNAILLTYACGSEVNSFTLFNSFVLSLVYKDAIFTVHASALKVLGKIEVK